MPLPSLVRRLLAPATFVMVVACSGDPAAISVDMRTDKVSRDFADRALGEFRKACAPLFTTHLADVSGLAAEVTDETFTVVRRMGWGAHIALGMKVASSPTTLSGLAEPDRRADFLIGGGDKPGFVALSPTAARLCDLAPAPGRIEVYQAVPTLTALLPRLKQTVTDAHRAWWADEMKRAMAGDYQSQRNIAWCWFDGCDGVKPIDDVEACAWRLVIVAAGHPKSDASDAENVDVDCRTNLGPNEQRTARAKAADLFRKIYGRSLPQEP